MQDAADNTVKGVFGGTYDGLDGSKCQDKVVQRAGQKAVAIAKAFRKCANGGATASCIGTGIGDSKAASKQTKLSDDVTSLCDLATGEPPGADNGPCAETAASFATCVGDLVDCEMCFALNDITGFNEDCDTLDDGTTNGSCVRPHQCTFDSASDNSSLQVWLESNTDPPDSLLQTLAISGTVDISCQDPDGNGRRVCECRLQTFAPALFVGIGVVCVTAAQPPGGCSLGAMDCDGVDALGFDGTDDHEIGVCTSNADCATQCTAYCAGLSVFRSACEGFCQSGGEADEDCNCDKTGSITCIMGGEDCDGDGGDVGSCEGKDDERATGDLDCHCQCLDDGAFGASTAGDLQCRLGARITFETIGPCDGTDVILALHPICIPLSSQEVDGRILNANEAATDTLDATGTLTGSPESCVNLDVDTTTGFELVGDVGFLDTAIGDSRFAFRVDCQ